MSIRIAFVGKPVPNLGYSQSSVTMFGYGFDRALCEHPGIDYAGAFHARAGWLAESMPDVDLAILHDTFCDGHPGHFWFPMEELRARAKRVVLALEVPSQLVDWNYCWRRRTGPRQTFIPAPVLLAEMNTQPKVRGRVLIDHDWPNAEKKGLGSMAPAYKALEPYRDQLDFCQMIRPPCRADELPSWVRPIPLMPYKHYLQATSEVETFVMPLKGSYNHSAVDFLVRGTRVITTPGVLIPELADLGARQLALPELGPECLKPSDWRTRADLAHKGCTGLDAFVARIVSDENARSD